ncbi:hypothetical protein Chor_005020, partial [Crotalus horridus]
MEERALGTASSSAPQKDIHRVGTLSASVLSQQQPHQCLKDFGLPNSSWSREMMDQFQKFTKMSEDGSWQRIPSYNSSVHSIPEGHQKRDSQNRERHFFVHNIGGEGLGFEYSVFMNPSERRAVALFQPGSYLEGPSGFANSGAIITILHQAVTASIVSINLNARIANLNIVYKRPVALGSVALVEAQVDRIKDRKVFVNFKVLKISILQSTWASSVGLLAVCGVQKLMPFGMPVKCLPPECLVEELLTLVLRVGTLSASVLSQQQPHQCLKDFGLPNSSWSREMMDQFQKFTKMSEDGSWQRIPSYNSSVHSIPAHRKSVYSPREQKEACLFVRNVATEGHGFEFAMFYNGAERRMVVLLQPGSYLEGMIGPIPLGSVVLVETKVEKVEEKKIFLSGLVRSTDTQTLHAEAT